MSVVKAPIVKGMMLTAGLGTRLRPVTDHYAKPAVPFLGIPLLYYPLHLMLEAGVSELTLNTHYKPEQIDRLAGLIAKQVGVRVHLSNESGAPLGSGGGIAHARASLEGGGDFLVSNGDEVILPLRPGVMAQFAHEHREHRALATIMVMRHPLVGTQFGGVWADGDGVVRGFGKDGLVHGEGLTGYHYIGLLLLNDRVFPYFPAGESNIFYDVLKEAIARGETVRVMVSEFTWFETGNPHDFVEATGQALRLLHSGAGEDARCLEAIFAAFGPRDARLVQEPDSLSLRSASAVVEEGARFKGFAVLDRNTRIESGASVENSVVLCGSTVLGTQSVRDQIILPNKSFCLV